MVTAKASHESLTKPLISGTSSLPSRSCPSPTHTFSMAPHCFYSQTTLLGEFVSDPNPICDSGSVSLCLSS